MDAKTMLLVGLVLGLIAAVFLFWPSPDPVLVPAAEIGVQDATGQWMLRLRGSSDLVLDAAVVKPRISTGHAATAGLVVPLSPSTELADAVAGNVAVRIVVEHAATASSIPVGTAAPPAIVAAPRILVQRAAAAALVGPIGSSSSLLSDGATVLPKLLIKDAAAVDVKRLEAMPPPDTTDE